MLTTAKECSRLGIKKPVINECYESVVNGEQSRIVIDSNTDNNYRKKLDEELKEMKNQELLKTASVLRKLRP